MINILFVLYTCIIIIFLIKLITTTRNLKTSEKYNQSLQILYDDVKGFKHDFNNIISTLDGYIQTNDITGLKNYFNNIKKECQITNNLTILNPNIINDAGIYSLINNKYFKATNLEIVFNIEVLVDISDLKINKYKLSRILGILLDNAIEEAQKCENKIIKLSFISEKKKCRNIISVENTYSNKDVDIEKIFTKGLSGKEGHSGLGLWEVKKYVSKCKNLDLFTTKNPDYFKQELIIYD